MAPLFDALTATAQDLQQALQSGTLTSVQIVTEYLEQISRHNGYLKAIAQLNPNALDRAKELDEIRARQSVGPLHGLPIVIKDNIDVKGLNTTAGCVALADALPHDNAPLVDRLLNAGMIVLGKTTMSELAWCKAPLQPCGWSALHGQAQSAFVRGGLLDDESAVGHSSPNGSSSGSCIAVSAGLCPLALGTETFGSLTNAAQRAGLYTIKLTPGQPVQGLLPASLEYDVVGPIAKCTSDVVQVLTVLQEQDFSCQPGWPTIGGLDPSVWCADPALVRPRPGADEQILRETKAAYTALNAVDVNLSPVDTRMDVFAGNVVVARCIYGFEASVNEYLPGLSTHIKTLNDLVEYNKAHPDALQSYGQEMLIEAVQPHDPQLVEQVKSRIDDIGATFLQAFDDNKVDIIIAPSDSPLFLIAGAAKCPCGVLPLGCLDYNGRPFALTIAARPHDELSLIRAMRAYEADFGVKCVPKAFLDVRS